MNLVPRDEKEIMAAKWVLLEEMESMSLNADVSLFRKNMINACNQIVNILSKC